jgi:hypothetical protein
LENAGDSSASVFPSREWDAHSLEDAALSREYAEDSRAGELDSQEDAMDSQESAADSLENALHSLEDAAVSLGSLPLVDQRAPPANARHVVFADAVENRRERQDY